MKIMVTGSTGLVGSAIKEISKQYDHEFIFATRKDADLTKEHDVDDLFGYYRPDWLIHTAAKVGGIGGNLSGPADYYYQNILMNSYVIHHAWKYGVQKLLAFSSVCVFPDGIPLLKEELMHAGEPFADNFAYAHAKRMVDVQIRAYRKQHGVKNYCSIIPGNVFGKRDLYNLTHGHVLPSLMHKVYLAKKNNTHLQVWGDGSPIREFIYAEDVARLLMKIINVDCIPERVIISGNKQYSIKQMVEMLCRVADYSDDVIWVTSQPNGQKARPTDLSVLKSLVGDLDLMDMEKALTEAYHWFAEHYPNVRL